ncbi:MAG TPA: response regulator [Pyrinomonadaceae bacterium]|jgi:DNA-binding response OmpR family regulator
MATILLVEEDDDARPIFRHNLRREGYDVLLAVDEASALDWLAAGSANADLILVNLVGKTAAEALEAGRRVRERNGADGSTPLVVIADHYDEEMEGRDVEAGEGEWVTYMEDAGQLNSLLSKLTAGRVAD